MRIGLGHNKMKYLKKTRVKKDWKYDEIWLKGVFGGLPKTCFQGMTLHDRFRHEELMKQSQDKLVLWEASLRRQGESSLLFPKAPSDSESVTCTKVTALTSCLSLYVRIILLFLKQAGNFPPPNLHKAHLLLGKDRPNSSASH